MPMDFGTPPDESHRRPSSLRIFVEMRATNKEKYTPQMSSRNTAANLQGCSGVAFNFATQPRKRKPTRGVGCEIHTARENLSASGVEGGLRI